MQRQIKCGLNSLKNRSLCTLLGLLESVFPTSYYIETKICFTQDGLLLWYGLGRYGTPEQVKGEPVIVKFVWKWQNKPEDWQLSFRSATTGFP